MHFSREQCKPRSSPFLQSSHTGWFLSYFLVFIHHEAGNQQPSDQRHRHPLLHDLQVLTPCNLQRPAASSTAPLFPVRTPVTRLPWPTCSSAYPADRSTRLFGRAEVPGNRVRVPLGRAQKRLDPRYVFTASLNPPADEKSVNRDAQSASTLATQVCPAFGSKFHALPSTGGDRFQVGLHIFFSNPSPNGESNPPYSGEYWSVVTTEGFRECQFEETTAAAGDRCAEISSSAVTRSLG
jgi:hypothetical protein